MDVKLRGSASDPVNNEIALETRDANGKPSKRSPATGRREEKPLSLGEFRVYKGKQERAAFFSGWSERIFPRTSAIPGESLGVHSGKSGRFAAILRIDSPRSLAKVPGDPRSGGGDPESYQIGNAKRRAWNDSPEIIRRRVFSFRVHSRQKSSVLSQQRGDRATVQACTCTLYRRASN